MFAWQLQPVPASVPALVPEPPPAEHSSFLWQCLNSSHPGLGKPSWRTHHNRWRLSFDVPRVPPPVSSAMLEPEERRFCRVKLPRRQRNLSQTAPTTGHQLEPSARSEEHTSELQ